MTSNQRNQIGVKVEFYFFRNDGKDLDQDGHDQLLEDLYEFSESKGLGCGGVSRMVYETGDSVGSVECKKTRWFKNELVRIIKENPELDVIAMVDHEIFFDEEFEWFQGAIGQSMVDECFYHNESVYLRSTDEDELREIIGDDIVFARGFVPDDMEEIVNSRIKWQKAIFVKIVL